MNYFVDSGSEVIVIFIDGYIFYIVVFVGLGLWINFNIGSNRVIFDMKCKFVFWGFYYLSF